MFVFGRSSFNLSDDFLEDNSVNINSFKFKKYFIFEIIVVDH